MLVKLAKIFRSLVGTFWLGKKIEAKFIASSTTYVPPPIFIVGLPRSGSTLLYQIISEYFETIFFSNISSVFVSYPCIIACLTKPFQVSASLDSYHSEYGVTSGFFSPSEAGGVYRYWDTLDDQKRRKLILYTINKISSIYKCPFIWKNLNLSREVNLLFEIFPNALFIKIDRDLEYVIQSIFLKIKRGGSIKIKGFEKIELNNSTLEKITREAIFLDQKTNKLLEREGINSIHVKYEDLSHSLSDILSGIKKSYACNGYELKKNRKAHKPKINIRNEIKMEKEEWKQMLEYIQEYNDIN